jgi:hypothetical protein
MDTSYTAKKSDQYYCIYEVIECEQNFDCVSCEVANRYWDEMRTKVLASLNKKSKYEHENEIVNTPLY